MSGPSIFTPLPIQSLSSRSVSAFAWNSSPSLPLLAVCTSPTHGSSHTDTSVRAGRTEGGTVILIDSEGQPYEDVVIRPREPGASPRLLAWSPPHIHEGSLLAIGWDDGMVMLWSLAERLAREDAEQHAPHPVSVLLWSPDAERLISGDRRSEGAATLAVWKVDSRGRHSTICPYKRPALGGLTHAIFRTAGRTTKLVTSAFAAADSSPFYFAGEAGAVAYATDGGQCSDCIGGLGASVAAMLYDEGSDILVLLLANSMLATFKLTDNKPAPLNKVKLSLGRDGIQSAIWAGAGHFAVASGDSIVRLQNVAEAENYNLMLADISAAAAAGSLVALAHEPQRGVLAAATREGSAVVWRRVGGAPEDEPEKAWAPLAPLSLGRGLAPVQLGWGPREGLLAMRYTTVEGSGTAGGLCLLPETVLARVVHGNWAAIQTDASTVRIENVATGGATLLQSEMRIVGAAIYANTLAIWSRSKVAVYEFDTSDRPRKDPKLLGEFESRTVAAALWDDHIYMCVGNRIEVANFIGSVQASMGLSDSEGEPIAIHIAGAVRAGAPNSGGAASLGAYVAVGTSCGFIKSWDISRQEPRQHAHARQLVASGAGQPQASRVTSVAIASDGSRISATLEVQPAPKATGGARAGNAAPTPWTHSPCLFTYVVESDAVHTHDFGLSHRVPFRHAWDAAETSLLAVETRPSPAAPAGASKLEVTTLFSTIEHGLKVRDTTSPTANTMGGDNTGEEPEVEGLIGIAVPHLQLILADRAEVEYAGAEDAEAAANKAREARRIQRSVLREFEGMNEEEIDFATSHALISFSYHLTVGEMDEAHRAVKKIKTASVWENMARMCVQTRRIDVAEICLGHMGHARGARALREAISAGADMDLCAGVLAVQLGQVEDAEKMYEASGRHDLLNELRQAQGDWDGAITLAEEKDRIHLRSTHYTYARILEAQGKTDAAIEHYEKAGTHRVDVPRMLFDLGRTSKLREYVDSRREPELYKWWAQYCESNGKFDKALDYYQHARDHLSIVRVLCFHGKMDAAAEVVHESGDGAAAYHLAKHCEEAGRTKDAVFFYQRAGRYNHAVRLAREHNMASELSNLATQASTKVMVETAQYFEGRKMYDQAVRLYHKGGNVSRALDICFRHNRFEALRDIADGLSADTDPALLRKVGDFFLSHGQYDKAVRLFTIAGEANRALELCVTQNVPLTEELAEALCPETGSQSGGSEQARNAMLLKIAKVCKKQGNYHLACKKYTQAGDKIKGMKCLLKSGDTEKIVFFAGVSRTRDIYILAANYLQNLDWHSDPSIMKNIVSFYTKAKAFESLASFYDMCAQVEIDEYRDYEKAVAALREALGHLAKARNVPGGPAKAEALQAKIAHVETFVAARKMVKSNPEEMVRRCNELLDQPGCEQAIRVGDVYALMIEWFYSQQQLERAYGLVERMRGQNIILAPYLDSEMIHAIYSAVGMPAPRDGPADDTARGGYGGEMDDDMDEEIEADEDDE